MKLSEVALMLDTCDRTEEHGTRKFKAELVGVKIEHPAGWFESACAWGDTRSEARRGLAARVYGRILCRGQWRVWLPSTVPITPG